MVEARFAVDEGLGSMLPRGGWRVRRAHVGVQLDTLEESIVVASVGHQFDIPVDNIHMVAEVPCNACGVDMVLFEDTTS